jgi:hypothetical protein
MTLVEGLCFFSARVSTHSREMTVIVSLSSVVVSPHLRSLQLDSVPKIIRSHLFDSLGLFRGEGGT